MKRIKHLSASAMLLILLILTACGFHIKGQQILPPELEVIYLKSPHFDPLTKSLGDNLAASGATLVSEQKNAPITLVINTPIKSQVATTVGASQQSRKYMLSYSVNFSIIDSNGKIIAGPFNASQQRTQILQASQILGATNQTEDLYNDMLTEVVRQIMDRLGSISVNQALERATMPTLTGPYEN